MYGEFFSVPEPQETVFISWFSGGEIFRSGLTWRRGAGSIFYFRPGHETYPTYHNPTIQQVIRNGVKWAYNPMPRYSAVHDAPNVPVDKALEPITERGPRLHQAGEEGYK
jgi:trehalose utilization protein